MKLITTLVYLSQAMRSMADKARRKAITSIQAGLKEIEVDLVDIEERRSLHMVAAHTEFYQQQDKLAAQYKKELEALRVKHLKLDRKNEQRFEEKRKCIAQVAKGAVTELVKTRASLSRELDHLTK